MKYGKIVLTIALSLMMIFGSLPSYVYADIAEDSALPSASADVGGKNSRAIRNRFLNPMKM